MYKEYFKRIVDIILSIIGLPAFMLIFICVAPLIKLEDGGSIFYLAKRRGINGSVFNMYKFRSMRMNAPDLRNKDNSTYNAPDDPRVTKVGKFLRKTSIDETAQIINVIKGDMSIIGPRPITTEKPLNEYDDKRKTRLQVKPGITGYSQAFFRNSISQEEKFTRDAYYAENVSFLFDLKIIIKTISTVLKQENIYNQKEK